MSGKVQGACYGRKLTRTQMLVALAMADHADHDGFNVRPSQELVAWKVGISLRTVQRVQSDLRELGVLVVVKGPSRGNPTVYQMVPEAVPLREKVATSDGLAERSPLDAQKVATTGERSPTDAVKGRHPDGVQTVIEPSLSPVKKPSLQKEQQNEVWDTLEELFGAPTELARAHRGKIVASLTRAGATQQEIYTRARAWPSHFPDATLTAAALEKFWNQLARPAIRRSGREAKSVDTVQNWQTHLQVVREVDDG